MLLEEELRSIEEREIALAQELSKKDKDFKSNNVNNNNIKNSYGTVSQKK